MRANSAKSFPKNQSNAKCGELLVQAALADGEMHEHEARLLKRAAQIFDLASLLEQLRIELTMVVMQRLDQCYAILESEPEDELSVIKKRYRRLR